MGFHGLCLVKAVTDDDWYMGSLNDDGSITCWSAYGDLYEALRGEVCEPLPHYRFRSERTDAATPEGSEARLGLTCQSPVVRPNGESWKHPVSMFNKGCGGVLQPT